MLAAILKLVSVRDYIYAAAAAAAVGWFLVHDHNERAAGAKHEAAAVAAASSKTQQAADIRVKQLTDTYTAQVKDITNGFQTQLAAASAQHNVDVERLRERAAASGNGAGAVLHSAAGSSQGAAANTGSAGASGLGEVPGTVTLELADALRHDDAALTACYADRDSLTGK